MSDAYNNFIQRLKLAIQKNPSLIVTTLSNIFSMRLIGNKTHGDLAEIAISEFINQYMYDYKSIHVGKDLFRAKSKEEDVKIIDEISQQEFQISLKAYGVGPLQLSTDKNFVMFPRLEQENSSKITDQSLISNIFSDPAFRVFDEVNVLPLIYDEKVKRCNIMIFDYNKAKRNVRRITKITSGRGRKHPVYTFIDGQDQYVCEVRYGGASANALQRGLWTRTNNGEEYFESITGGWVDYSNNKVLVQLFSHALVSSESGHSRALEVVKDDIQKLKRMKN